MTKEAPQDSSENLSNLTAQAKNTKAPQSALSNLTEAAKDPQSSDELLSNLTEKSEPPTEPDSASSSAPPAQSRNFQSKNALRQFPFSLLHLRLKFAQPSDTPAQQAKQQEMRQAREELQNEFLTQHPRLAQMSSEELQTEMLRHASEDEKVRKQKLRSHIEALSDGVIAVIITIMLLEIPMPTSERGYLGFLEAVGIFLISFIVIANFWFNHHKTFAVTEEITESIIVQDFIFMGLLSLIPLLSKWIMVQPSSFSCLNYGIVLLLILLQQELMSRAITHDRFRKMPKSFKFWQKIWTTRLVVTLFANIIIIIIAVASPYYGHWLFVAIPVLSFLGQLLSDNEMPEFAMPNPHDQKSSKSQT